MPREAGRPREIELPIPSRRGAASPDATTIEKPVRAPRPAVARVQVEDEESRKRGPGGAKVARPAVKTNDDGRTRQKLTITNFDREAQVRSLASLKRKREKEKLKAMGIQQTREKISREVVIPEAITIQELSNRMAERAVDLAKAGQGHPAFSSAMKYYGTELNKRRYEILMSAGGIDALEWESPRSKEGARARDWLRTKANSIEGGTSEVMLGIVAKRILDLPGA